MIELINLTPTHITLQNTLFVRRKNKVIVTSGNTELPIVYLATALKNLESIGFTFSNEIIDILKTYSKEEFILLYKNLVPVLREKVGAHMAYKPMYPNFPEQVMQLSIVELYINAILHYIGDWIDIRIMPQYEKEERFPLIDRYDLTVIELGTKEEFQGLFQNLMESKTSISQSDKDDIATYISIHKGNIILPTKFYFKEISAFVLGELLKYDIPLERITAYFKSATDVLRFATALSGGDVSLADRTMYINFSRKKRKLFLSLLENIAIKSDLAADMKMHQTKWIRLGERLHPADYKAKFPLTVKAFDRIRENETIETFNTKLELYLKNGEIKKLIPLLKERAGVFGRLLNHTLSITTDKDYVIENFAEIINQINPPNLLQLMSYFRNRNNQDDLRIFFPKGNASKVQAIPNKLSPFPSYVIEKIISLCEKALIKRFSSQSDLGKVYLDEQLKDYLVPFSQRSASKSFKTIVRGSKFPLSVGKTIRFFIGWKNIGYERVDLDLTSIALDANFQYKCHISYTNLRNAAINSCHSGDLTSAPEPDGAAEFIDVDIESAINFGVRYIVMNVFSFTQQFYSTIPDCFAGWMMREHPDSGEIFEARTVQNKFDLTTNTKIVIPLIIDLQTRQITWADLGLTSNPNHSNNIERNYSSVSLMTKAMLSLINIKPTLYDLFNLHIQARNGILVTDIQEAEIVFSVNEGITPFDIELIMAQYL